MNWHGVLDWGVGIVCAALFYEVFGIVTAIRKLLESYKLYVDTLDIAAWRETQAKKELRERPTYK